MSFAQNWLGGLAAGRQRRLEDEALGKQNRLAELAGDAFSAPLEQRGDYFAQMARLDPETAVRFQNLSDGQADRQRTQVGNMAKMLAVAPEQYRGSMYAKVAPALRNMGIDAPDQWDESLLPVIQSLGGGDQAQSRVQSTQILNDGTIALVMNDGSIVRTGEQAQAPFSVQEFRNPDGTVSYNRIPTRSYGDGGIFGGSQQAAPQPRRDFEITPTGEAELPSGPAMEQIMAGLQSGQPFSVSVPPSGAPVRTAQGGQASPSMGGQGFGQTDEQRAVAEARAAELKKRAEATVAMQTFGDQAQAESDSKARQAAPKTVADGELLLSQLSGLLNDPNLDIVTGLSGAIDPRSWPIINRAFGTADTLLKVRQVQGQAFLQAYNSLKGGGTITEIEGAKAEAAIARLSTAQSDEGFRAAINDFIAAVTPGIEKARGLMQRQGQAPQNEGGYEVDDVIDANGKRYRVTGGDPNDPDVEEII